MSLNPCKDSSCHEVLPLLHRFWSVNHYSQQRHCQSRFGIFVYNLIASSGRSTHAVWKVKTAKLRICNFSISLTTTSSILLIRISSRVNLAMSVCPYERLGLGNYKSETVGTWHVVSSASYAAQVCSSRVPRPQTTITLRRRRR